MGALRGVALAAFVVDESCGWVREGATFRIAHARPPNCVDVEHPAVPEADQSRIHLAREHGELLMAGRLQIGPRIRPGGQEASVLQQAYALVDEGGVVREIGKTFGLLRQHREHQSSTER